ncbi:glycosyltransferase family 2 protein [Dyadobacter sandarakinus]|uniref:Glycosyltransferase n=1 Tax=Dyadobacter sandarakinus TaxID=2747268 RepID=A0ABX7I0E8_9BACT|nr:glycosyltransferase [Dyadobacter sandarakinus]QRQ99468.1 glycosyltransferase [Dyadobacter sandarakinus]
MVSIIVPCYNCEHFVERAVNSVLGQTYTDWELILVNNNSTDGTQLVLEKIASTYPDKVQVYQEFKKGAPAARNKGLRAAKGEWVQYLDADDELLPDKLKVQVELGETQQADCVIGNANLIELKNGVLAQTRRPLNTEDVWSGLITSHLGITTAILWRKSRLDHIQGWDENLTSSQEYDMMFRLLKNGAKVIFDPAENTLIHKTDSGISKNPDKNKMLGIIDNRVKLRLQIEQHLKQISQLTEARKNLIYRYIFLELTGNKIDIAEYRKTRLDGASLDFPMQWKLDHFVKTSRKSIVRGIKSVIGS